MDNKYHFMSDDEAGTNLIVDEYKENLASDLVEMESISRSLALNSPNLNALLLMAKANAIFKSRKNG